MVELVFDGDIIIYKHVLSNVINKYSSIKNKHLTSSNYDLIVQEHVFTNVVMVVMEPITSRYYRFQCGNALWVSVADDDPPWGYTNKESGTPLSGSEHTSPNSTEYTRAFCRTVNLSYLFHLLVLLKILYIYISICMHF